MAFALTAVRIEEALRKPGCPICRLGHEAAAHSADSFLWENVNDPQVRKPIIDAYGFCPVHTRLLVATEMASSGPVLGVNMIYEQLGRLVGGELHRLSFRKRAANSIRDWWQKLTSGAKKDSGEAYAYLHPNGVCPICSVETLAWKNTLTALFEELEFSDRPLWSAYRKSDGICLSHLRSGLSLFFNRFPNASRQLCEDAAQRLSQQSRDMLEYIRKNNWEYRQEQITAEEGVAWRRTLTFFTGYPGQKFTFKFDDHDD